MTQQCAFKYKISLWHALDYTEIELLPNNQGLGCCIKGVGRSGAGPQPGDSAMHSCSVHQRS